MQVAESFELNSETYELHSDDADDGMNILSKVARLDTCVTVVDASTFSDMFTTAESIKERYNEGEGSEGDKKIGQLMVEQIEFADVILLNKADLVTTEQLREYEKTLSMMNREAKIISCTSGEIDINEIINTNLYSKVKAESAPGWLADLQPGAPAHVPETIEYNISSFVYRARKPFNAERLYNFVQPLFTLEDSDEKFDPLKKKACAFTSSKLGKILRSKGFCWLASHPNLMIEWNQGGYNLQLNLVGEWYAERSRSEWSQFEQEIRDKILLDWKGEFGDKRQELVFIGVGLNHSAISDALDSCLITDQEMKIEQHFWRSHSNKLFTVPLQTGGWNDFVVAGGFKKFTLSEGINLVIQNVSLDYSELSDVTVKVFIKQGIKKILFATLRAGHYDQFHGEVTIQSTGYIVTEIANSKGVAVTPETAFIHLSGLVLQDENQEEEDEHKHDDLESNEE